MALTFVRVASLGTILISVLGFSACNSEPKEKKSGQALVSINGKEVTILQLNDELKRSGVRVDQYEIFSLKTFNENIKSHNHRKLKNQRRFFVN
jgi:peptidyl-prolyl cis-trans isomerase C